MMVTEKLGIKVERNPSESKIAELGVRNWSKRGCPPSKFPWTYTAKETGKFNNAFRRIITAAQHPHLSIPETKAGKNRKQYRRLVNRSLVFVSVGATAAIIELVAYRVYAARKSSSA